MIFHLIQELEPRDIVVVALVVAASLSVGEPSCGVVADEVGKVLA
jgi:hypothetical protein